MIVKVRIAERQTAQRFMRCGILFTHDWQDVEVDAATFRRLKSEQMLDVRDSAPPGKTAEEIAAEKEAAEKAKAEKEAATQKAKEEKEAAKKAAAENAAAEKARKEALKKTAGNTVKTTKASAKK